jgi:hypothetical protein
MSEPRTFRTRLVMIEIGRPMSLSEIATLVGITRKQAAITVWHLCKQDLARRVGGASRYRYEATA